MTSIARFSEPHASNDLVRGLAWSPRTEARPVEVASHTALMATLRESGTDSGIARSLALALGIPVKAGEERIPGRGRTVKAGSISRGVLVPVDPSLDYVVFIRETADRTTYLLSTSQGGLKRAVVNDRAKIFELPPHAAAEPYAAEVAHWRNEFRPSAPEPAGNGL